MVFTSQLSMSAEARAGFEHGREENSIAIAQSQETFSLWRKRWF
jgi:hypothetical protein